MMNRLRRPLTFRPWTPLHAGSLRRTGSGPFAQVRRSQSNVAIASCLSLHMQGTDDSSASPWSPRMMPLVVTSASGANGDGYGALLAFDESGEPLGPFSDDSRIVDPRGMAVDGRESLLFLNSGADRVLALDCDGTVVRDTGPIEGLNPGGGIFGPDGRYYVGLRTARTIMAFSPQLDAPSVQFLPP